MKTVIILAMHGVPPNDFPQPETAEFFMLDGRLKRETGPDKARMVERHSQLDAKMRNWPRTAKNDPFYIASLEMAQNLGKVTGNETLAGFNEFCAPDLKETMEMAVRKGAGEVIVVTPMMTRGGEHAEKEIPSLIGDFQKRHPDVKTIYAWPFDAGEVARFLAQHIARFTSHRG